MKEKNEYLPHEGIKGSLKVKCTVAEVQTHGEEMLCGGTCRASLFPYANTLLQSKESMVQQSIPLSDNGDDIDSSGGLRRVLHK
jgi:hypothetical protein